MALPPGSIPVLKSQGHLRHPVVPCRLAADVALNTAAAAAKSLQSCPTLCDPIDGSPPGSPVPGILQARVLEWLAIAFSALNTTFTFFFFPVFLCSWSHLPLLLSICANCTSRFHLAQLMRIGAVP